MAQILQDLSSKYLKWALQACWTIIIIQNYIINVTSLFFRVFAISNPEQGKKSYFTKEEEDYDDDEDFVNMQEILPIIEGKYIAN